MNSQRETKVNKSTWQRDKPLNLKSDSENERVITLSFSSEEPYERYFGPEILDHQDGAIDMSRLQSIGCVLFNHNRDSVIGKIRKAWIENNRGYAEIEFDTDEFSEKIFQKVKNGTLKGVSVSYVVNNYESVKEGKKSTDGRFNGPCYIARNWEPLEISVVSVPADPTVGVGREFNLEELTEKYAEKGLEIYQAQLQINQNIFRRLKNENY